MPPKGLLSNSPSVALLKEKNFQRMAQNNPAQYYQQTPIGAAAIEGLLGTWAGQAYEQDIKPAYDAWTPQWSDLYNAPMAMAEGIGGVMKDAMDDPEDPRKMLDAGLLTVGMGGGATAMLGGVPRGALGMHVWQGGPHKYGAKGASESLQHMGKGEGAQAYGWGRYDAGAKDVGQDYKRTLSGDWSDINRVGDALYDALDPLPNGDVLFKGSKYSKAEFDRVIVPQLDGRDLWGSLPPGLRTATEKKLEGYLYKHDLPDDDIARYLDWDAPLSEQPESVRAALKRYGVDLELDADRTGEQAYNSVMHAMDREAAGGVIGRHSPGSKQAASEALGRAGIPGLKYYDGSSRGAGQGTRNYVTWDQDVLNRMKLLERNGESMSGKSISGMGEVWYRGDKPGLTSFEIDNSTSSPGNIFLSSNERLAGRYAKTGRQYDVMNPPNSPEHGLYRTTVDRGNSLEIDAGGAGWDEVPVPNEMLEKFFLGTGQIDDIAAEARAMGYDSLLVRDVLDQYGDGDQLAVFNPARIKMTDAMSIPMNRMKLLERNGIDAGLLGD